MRFEFSKSVSKKFLPLLILAVAAAHPAWGSPCSLAAVTKMPSASQLVCDTKTVMNLARQGHAFEENQLGMASILAIGPEFDVNEAVGWFEKSASRGYAPAQVNLAVIYANGWGVPQNYGVALRWLREAAEQKYPRAYYNLGELYFKGTGVRQDYPEALRYFRLGAEAGDTAAETNLAYMYDRGLGVEANLATAVAWYRKASDSGDAMAQSNLADLYARGQGVPEDQEMAFRLYQRAALQGHTGAEIQVAYRLSAGQGTKKDLQAAMSWVVAAVSAGDNRGQELLTRLQSQLKPGDVKRARETAANVRSAAEAERRAASFQP